MKTKCLLITLLMISAGMNAHAQNWVWAKKSTGVKSIESRSIVSDANGNTYITGMYADSSISFGTIVLNNDTINNTHDVFIVKYSSSGDVIWAKNFGSTGNDYCNSITLDPNGDLYITGQFASPAIIFDNDTLRRKGTGSVANIFIAKLDTAGNVIYARNVGGINNDIGDNITTDNYGNVYISGSFASDTLDFGSFVITKSLGMSDVYLSKLNASGDFVWARQATGNQSDYSEGMGTDASGNVYITGRYGSATLDFGSIVLTNAGGGGNPDMFIAKYDSSGNLLWAKSAGGTSVDEGLDLSIDVSGNIFVTGMFFGPTIKFGTTTLTTNGSYDIFVVKYNSSGNVVWAKSAGGTNFEYALTITNDLSGNVLIAGLFQSPTLTFGSTTLTRLGNSSSQDVYIAKYDASGNVVWAVKAGGVNSDGCNKITTDATGNAFITGNTTSPVFYFGTDSLTHATQNGYAYVAKISSEIIEGYPFLMNEDAISIYPNPFHSSAILTLRNISTSTNAEVIIYDMVGKEMTRIPIAIGTGNELKIEKGNLQCGVYFVQVRDEERQWVEKIMVE